jgi:lysyl-tRNA synthetase class 2
MCGNKIYKRGFSCVNMGREEQIIDERLRKIKELRKQNINPYPSLFEKKECVREIRKKYAKLKEGEKTKETVKTAGRLMSARDMGKIAFGTILDDGGKIQIILQEPLTDKKTKEFFKKYVDAGDFVGIEGPVTVTNRGELSVVVKKLSLLSKSILPLPAKWHGFQDPEERFRKRYLDILMNPEVREMFVRKSKFWNSVREFLLKKGFLEVETPVLETAAGGAAATPFATHHNALDVDVYLRISMGELWQKRLMVAGYEKTFEIGRQFRNEGMDADHLQDYTQMEFYWGYANYEMGMGLVEELYKEIAKKVFGTTKFERNGHKFDLEKEWKVIDYTKEIKKQTDVDIWKATKAEVEKKLKELKEEYDPRMEKARLVDLLWKYCRRKISGPVFLTGQPAEITPLAKRNAKDPRTVEQFQIILAGTEAGNGYSELNDPLDQEERFLEQRKLTEQGDEEAHPHDADFVEALKHGMPPTCGFGFSERLFALLEGKPIRETVIFPLMKPLKQKRGEAND